MAHAARSDQCFIQSGGGDPPHEGHAQARRELQRSSLHGASPRDWRRNASPTPEAKSSASNTFEDHRPANRSQGRRAAPHTTLPMQSCAGAMRYLELARPSAVLRSTSQCRRNEGARAPASGALLGRSTRCEPERHATAITDAKADQMGGELFKIAIEQIGDDPSKSFERC